MTEIEAKIKEIKRKIKELEEQIANLGLLKTQLKTLEEAQAILTGKQVVFVHSAVHGHFAGEASTKPKSILDATRSVLMENGRPMHVNDICTELYKMTGKLVKKPSVASAIVRSIQNNEDLFIRTGPNTFGLKDLKDQYDKENGSELSFTTPK